MSHQPERTEKNCLNCGTTVAGRYCQRCGQENIVTKQPFGSLVRHFIYDIFHFDGKFWDTVKYLLFKPGYIPKQYVSGKRISYLDPIRMYLFTSAVFFLIFFNITKGSANIFNVVGDRSMTKLERLDYASRLHLQAKQNANDSLSRQQLNYLLDTNYRIELKKGFGKTGDSAFQIRLGDEDYVMRVLKRKSPNDNGIEFSGGALNRSLEQKWIRYKRQFGDDDRALARHMGNTFLHNLPYMLFISLPLFAAFLKLLYIRRKQFVYSDHAVFTIYHYIFSFLLLLAVFGFAELRDYSGWKIFSYLNFAIIVWWLIYLYKAMRRFYEQKRLKTIAKFLLLVALGFIMMLVLFVVFLILSFLQL